jgi:hypothetical protein
MVKNTGDHNASRLVKLQGPVVQSWISANPGLKSNLLF